MLFQHYQVSAERYDEAFHDKRVREAYRNIVNQFEALSMEELLYLNEYAKISFFNQGITFNVYSESAGTEKIFPFDLFPRIITGQEWSALEQGLLQRTHAINTFLQDIYNDKKIIRDKIIPADLLLKCKSYNRHMEGFIPRSGVYCHISGTDLIRHCDGEYYVLEDNVRCPSGVSYVYANRTAVKRSFANVLFQDSVISIESYTEELLATMESVAPDGVDEPNCVLLTPGMYNSAYYEHTFLAYMMGIELVEGRDLFVDNNFVYMKTIYGPARVDVIYRRIDEEFLDPLVYRPDSLLGVPGIMEAYRQGNVTIINAPGTGIADDKAIYAYLPHIIRYYLGEEPILNNVPTYICAHDDDCRYVLENLKDLVTKPVGESGGYGIVIGPKATRKELAQCRENILANPRNYIAQPVMSLSVHPTFIDDKSFEPRHIDLRTFTLIGREREYILKGGLTRVALKKDSLIVNSSQGGGSKDTWVMEE
ncbi:protein of unknown function DUF404 [Desulfurispirillum indicum S5]|uniref:Circularly permuted ATP-grasp type 2 domain-containing protein n=1 Tax=Desulfurispirillum indicum (strain ATCC BAA-1389 / DSM 22839 / S5) TaxID=653733 RepID=E6W510_DESIS|nr:circularly permuted type 2 ATP-grasp protein [Desulfurispirillum indicum]ADU65986.1 protein of unknown function DUF404 [Desulfurispirillum indicum S5]